MLDTVRSVETPEGVELRLRVAGPVPRLFAWLLDVLLRGVVYAVAAIPLGILGKGGIGLYLILLFLGEWFFPVYFEVKRGGATPGKKAMGLMVLEDDGTPVSLSASMIRNLLRFADFLPLAYGFGIITMLATRDFKRLGDLAAGTVVVHRAREDAAPSVPPAPPIPPPFALALDEQRAVIDFAERLPTWTRERASELASIVRPVTGASGAASVSRLVGMASWLLGRR